MAKAPKVKVATEPVPTAGTIAEDSKMKLRKLIVKNLCCIGQTPVEIELDDVVVLVGPNNAGKSTILRAYELITSSSSPQLSIEDFPGGKIDETEYPTIELHTAVVSDLPAPRWIQEQNGEKIVRERWVWAQPDARANREGWNVEKATWVSEVPWGAPNVANSRRPIPHRIEAFANPTTQVEEVTDILLKVLTERLENRDPYQRDEKGELVLDKDEKHILTQYGVLLNAIADNQKAVVGEAKAEIDDVETRLTKFVEGIFVGYEVKFDAKPEDDLSRALSFFKAGTTLRMGPKGGHLSDVSRQGSGARRTLMWAALRYIAETNKKTKASQAHLLLLDEPELCLHPNAVREACRILYDLPTTGTWQVMLTTHSPAFIDLSRDNTTVIRVERRTDNTVSGTTVFRPTTTKLSLIEKQELKLLNYYDPHVAEFFFGGRTILVEGDTEYTAFRWVMAQDPSAFKDVHIVRARGKATIALLAKILNPFGAKYAVLHDSDRPKVQTKDGEIVNPAWTSNSTILTAVNACADKSKVRLVAAGVGFEYAMFGSEAKSEKPYNAYSTLKTNAAAKNKVADLLMALIDFDKPVPDQCIEWDDLAKLEEAVNALPKI